jgi:hypothetical protein
MPFHIPAIIGEKPVGTCYHLYKQEAACKQMPVAPVYHGSQLLNMQQQPGVSALPLRGKHFYMVLLQQNMLFTHPPRPSHLEENA